MAFPNTFANVTTATGAQLDANFNALSANNGSSLVGFLQSGTGAVARTVQSKEQDTVNAKDFGAVEDGTTDDTAAVQLAANSFGALGGIVQINGICRIAGNLTIPLGVCIKGTYQKPVGGTWLGLSYPPVPANITFNTMSAIKLATTATITLQASAGISGCFIYPFGMTFPQSGDSLWTGTAVTITGDGAFVENSMIMGFATGITSTNCQRLRIQNNNFDNSNNISISIAGDVNHITNNHAWNWATIQSGAPASALQRHGTSYFLSGSLDWSQFTDNFCFGYQFGYRINSSGSVTLTQCSADNIAQAGWGIGFYIQGTSYDVQLVNCQSAAQDVGVSQQSTNPNTRCELVGCNIWGNINHGVLIDGTATADLSIVGGVSRNNGTGLTLNNATSRVDLDGVRFEANTVTLSVLSSTTNLRIFNNCDFGSLSPTVNITNNPTNINVPQIASAATLSIPHTGNSFIVTGVTGFNAITTGWAGRIVTLEFTGILTVTNGSGAVTAISLNGGSNYITSANSTLTLFHNGIQWYEIGRSSPIINTSTYDLNNILLIGSTAPTIASGFGTNPSIVHSNGTASFQINVGTGGTATSGVLTFPAAPNGWMVNVSWNGSSVNMNTYAVMTSTTQVTLTNQTSSTGATVAWPASTILNCTAFPL